MTIDEAIAKYKEKAKFFKQTTNIAYGLELEQIAAWLEELVMLRLDSCMIHMPERLQLVENGYNKALDDFERFARTLPTVEEEDGTIRPMWLEEMAEQLKAGNDNVEVQYTCKSYPKCLSYKYCDDCPINDRREN